AVALLDEVECEARFAAGGLRPAGQQLVDRRLAEIDGDALRPIGRVAQRHVRRNGHGAGELPAEVETEPRARRVVQSGADRCLPARPGEGLLERYRRRQARQTRFTVERQEVTVEHEREAALLEVLVARDA